jgi:hypothetical protein
MRVANIVQALKQIGEVDLFCILSPGEDREIHDAEQIPSLAVARLGSAPRPGTSYSIGTRLRWLAGSTRPFDVGTRDYSAVRGAFQGWARSPYDLIWMEHAETFAALGDLADGPTIVDLDDLEDYKARGRLEARRRDAATVSWRQRAAPVTLARSWGSRLQVRFDARRWRRLQERIVASAAAVTVCSGVDRARLGTPNCFVVPNGYELPDRPLGHLRVTRPPNLMLVGTLTYTPNADAARYFVRDILPRIRAMIPDVQLRLVGEYDARVGQLASDDVVLTGSIPDVGPELARADVAVVPLRFGGGTRIKILEAFAHGIPVVSTAFGCHGLDAVDGEHLLVADDPNAFAAACADLLADDGLRCRLADSARDLYWRRYRWDVIRPRIAELGTRIAEGGRRGSGEWIDAGENRSR